MALPAQRPAPVPSAPTAPSKMSLASIVRGKQERPIRVVLYGEAGIGKSTFGSEAPSPIFVGAEDGTSHLDVARFPAPDGWPDILEAVRVLERDEHGFKTVVFDTLDWMEPLIWDFICKRDRMENIESYGYQKGQKVVAPGEWRIFLAALERVYTRRNMNVIMLAHSHVKEFKNPEGSNYDRWQMKIEPVAAAIIREWSDATLFARFETFAQHEESDKKKQRRAKGFGTDKRIIHAIQTAAYDAKNRYSLPAEMPLDWATFEAATKARQTGTPDELKAAIREAIPQIPEKHRAAVEASLEKAGDDAEKLAKLNAWCNANVPEVQQ